MCDAILDRYFPQDIKKMINEYFRSDVRNLKRVAIAGEFDTCFANQDLWNTTRTTKDNLNIILCGGCRGGYVEMIKEAIVRGANDWHEAFCQAVFNGEQDILNMLEKHAPRSLLEMIEYDESYFVFMAARGNNKKILQLIAGKSDRLTFNGACRGGHLNLVSDLEFKCNNANNWWPNFEYSACRGGHLHIVNFLISKGHFNFEEGLIGAARGGHMNLILKMIERGASNWDDGLYNACCGEHHAICTFFIQKGATYCGFCGSLDNH